MRPLPEDSYIRDIKRPSVPPPVRLRTHAAALRRVSRISVVLGVLCLLLGLGLHPVADRPEFATQELARTAVVPAAGPANVTVNATDTAPYFSPGNLSVTAGTDARFVVQNLGQYDRTFTLSSVANFTIPVTDSPQQLNAFFTANGTLANVSVPAGANASAAVSFPASDAGSSFEFVSLTPYQFQAGAYGFVHVGYASSSGSYALTVQTTDALQFVPNTLVIPNATAFPITVSVEVSNAGTVQHTFTLEGQNNNSLNPSNFSTYFDTHPPAADVNVPTVTGEPVWANFTLTGKGAFEFICTVPGHFRLPNGNFGWIYVGWTPAPPAAPARSAFVGVAFLAGAGGLLAIGVVLAAAANFAGRFPRSAPPPGHH